LEGGVNTVKTRKLKKCGGCMTPPAPMVAPPLLIHTPKSAEGIVFIRLFIFHTKIEVFFWKDYFNDAFGACVALILNMHNQEIV